MEKPSLFEFGISEDEHRHWKYWEEFTLWSWAKRVSLSLPLLLAVLGYSQLGIGFAIFSAFVIGLPLAFFGSLFVAIGGPPLVSQVRPGLKRYLAYKAAEEHYKSWELRAQKEYWRSLTGHSFEVALGGLFKRFGYEVSLTPMSGDQGIDLVIKKAERRIIVQCKATRNPVGPAIIRELYGALTACKADLAVLAATGGVTGGVRQFAVGKPILILTLTEILSFHHGQDPIEVYDSNRRLNAASV